MGKITKNAKETWTMSMWANDRPSLRVGVASWPTLCVCVCGVSKFDSYECWTVNQSGGGGRSNRSIDASRGEGDSLQIERSRSFSQWMSKQRKKVMVGGGGWYKQSSAAAQYKANARWKKGLQAGGRLWTGRTYFYFWKMHFRTPQFIYFISN